MESFGRDLRGSQGANMLYNRFKKLKYTLSHRKAFRLIEAELFGKTSLRGYLHDLDKVFMYPLLGVKLTSKIHRRFSRHHIDVLIQIMIFVKCLLIGSAQIQQSLISH